MRRKLDGQLPYKKGLFCTERAVVRSVRPCMAPQITPHPLVGSSPHTKTPAVTTSPALVSPEPDERAAVGPGVAHRPFLVALLVCVLSGVAFGAGIGFIPFYLTYHRIGQNCAALTTEIACSAVKHASCVWAADPRGPNRAPACQFRDFRTVRCEANATEASCRGSCSYDFQKRVCRHQAGYSPTKSAVFGCMYFVGNVIGPFLTVVVLDRFSFSGWLLAVAGVLLGSTVLHHIARATNAYWLFVIARAVMGVATGGARFGASVFAMRTVPDPTLGGLASAAVQPSTEIGALIAGLITYFARPRDLGRDLRIEQRIHGQLCFYHLIVLAIAATALVLVRRGAQSSVSSGAAGSGAVPLPPDGVFVPLARFPGKLVVGAVVALGLVFTGLVPLTSYSPLYASDVAGIDSAVAPLLISAVATPAGLLGFGGRAVARHPRRLLLVGLLGICAATLLLAIASTPGVVAGDAARHALSIAAVIFFFLSLETCVGSTFFQLAIEIQPAEGRAGGAAFMNAVLGVGSVACSFLFPVAVSGMSGGPSGNQLIGFAASFYFFAVVALLSFAVAFKYVKPHHTHEPFPGPLSLTSVGTEVAV